VTTVYVTHDQVEAMTLGQRVAVMRDGRILQVDVPQRLYGEPRSLFVAAFIGSPPMNLVEAQIDGDVVRFGQYRVRLDPARRPRQRVAHVILGLRPESLEDAAFAPRGAPAIEAIVEVVEELGADAHVFFHVDAAPITGDVLEEPADASALLAEEKALFTARVDPRTRARPGARLALALDASRFHFFDPTTGASLLGPPSGAVPDEVPAELVPATGDPPLLAGPRDGP
jgi:multiple sugar transport system ATP-binding protein